MYTLDEALTTKIPDVASPIADLNGNIALVYYQQLGRVLTKCGQAEYVFITHANICLTWAHPDHVPCVLAKKGGCCGQKRPGIFRYANASNVRQWTNRGGR